MGLAVLVGQLQHTEDVIRHVYRNLIIRPVAAVLARCSASAFKSDTKLATDRFPAGSSRGVLCFAHYLPPFE